MASHPPAQCCTIGVKHDGAPSGEKVTVAGKFDGYLATPSADKAHKDTFLLYLPDVFGIWPNSQLMADQFAANGYQTLVLDLFKGDALKAPPGEGFDFMKWLTQGSSGDNPHTKEAIDPIVEAALKEIKEKYGAKKIGALGYCFGAKYVARHYKNGIDVGYFAHPSFVDEDELAAITGPLSISAAETDHIFPADKRHQSEDILKKTGHPYQINLFSGVEHGFAVRADLSNKKAKFAKEQAFYQAVAWFDEYLA